jgi:predicted nucleic acid-binding protein
MAEQYKKPYFDSSVFIAWIKGEIVTTEEEENKGDKTLRVIKTVHRKIIVDHLLKQAQNGDFKIHTSSFTLAEVHKKRNHEKLTNDQDEKILAFFENDFIALIDVDRTNGEDANQICRDVGLLPADATHLACALRAGCDVLLAWDDRVTRASHPRIRIEEPEIIGDLDLFAQAVTIERIEKVSDVKTTKKD